MASNISSAKRWHLEACAIDKISSLESHALDQSKTAKSWITLSMRLENCCLELIKYIGKALKSSTL